VIQTTQRWGKPLELAEFKLVVPDSLKIGKTAYPCHTMYRIEGEEIYFWRMEQSMPEKDMVFHYSRQ